MTQFFHPINLLSLLQLCSSALPVGAYSYSEGLETLVQAGKLSSAKDLEHWLYHELRYGSVRVESAVMVRIYRAMQRDDRSRVLYWNDWLSAMRETEELRSQSWQMGRSLVRLLLDTHPSPSSDGMLQSLLTDVQVQCGNSCNFATAFALGSLHWQLEETAALTGYLFSWVNNLVGAGVRLIPLGQTAGQQVLLNLHSTIDLTVQAVLGLSDDDLTACGWGLSLASMNHETQYSRLFRS